MTHKPLDRAALCAVAVDEQESCVCIDVSRRMIVTIVLRHTLESCWEMGMKEKVFDLLLYTTFFGSSHVFSICLTVNFSLTSFESSVANEIETNI